jgi:hypothetical protein
MSQHLYTPQLTNLRNLSNQDHPDTVQKQTPCNNCSLAWQPVAVTQAPFGELMHADLNKIHR